jgi:GDPmannose 4,6-dehydratase
MMDHRKGSPDPGPILITGVNGQDGVHLVREYAARGTRVVGTLLPGSTSAYLAGVTVEPLDVRDPRAFAALLDRHQPSVVVNLAALSSIGISWSAPSLAAEVNGAAVVGLLQELQAFRDRTGWAPRFVQASTADVFGLPVGLPIAENHPRVPISPYGIAKLVAHEAVVAARVEGLFAANAILFNHESALRPQHFVTRKITSAAASIALGLSDSITLGRLDVRRDWGSAADAVTALRLIGEAVEPDDFVIATGASRSLASVVELAFGAAGVADPWTHVIRDPDLMRPADVPDLVGDPSHAQSVLGWRPVTAFEDVIARMVDVDRQRQLTGVEDDPAYL